MWPRHGVSDRASPDAMAHQTHFSAQGDTALQRAHTRPVPTIRAAASAASADPAEIHEPASNTYLGIACSRCREPIPVSAKLAERAGQHNCEETDGTHSFPLRCRACNEEGVYAVTEIRDFKGEPMRRRSREHANGPQKINLSKREQPGR
jgi:hypothetical protein